MNLEKLAELLFPNNKYTVEELEKKYPKRNLKEGAEVTRFAPSPTGFMHLGNFFQATISYNIGKRSGGVFFIRIEDTDQKREVSGASAIIMEILTSYGYIPDEYQLKGGVTVGEYGPYYQSERVDIYKAYAKKLVAEGKAFPCFCKKTEGLSDVKEKREKKFSVGINEDKDPCRNLTLEQIEEYINEGKKFAIRLKSNGSVDKKVKFYDVIKGEIEMAENCSDAILLKNDMIPTYHFAHAVDDTLMGTTVVVRGEEWLPSVPLHKEIFDTLGYKQPKYIHNPLLYKLNEEGNRNKLSKRKHPEADMRFFDREGYDKQAVIEYLINLINSNFEIWRKNNPSVDISEFPFDGFNITANTPIFDLVKLNDISKEIISRYSAKKCYEELLLWARAYSPENVDYLVKDKDYVIKVLNIDREKPKPRKDIYKWNMFFDLFDYMFGVPSSYEVENQKQFEEVVKNYQKYLCLDSKDIWFEKVKEMAGELGYATDNKAYKQNPENFKGNVATVCEYIRVAITGRKNSPDLYEIMSLLGKEEVLKRLSQFA
ncbi:MAG: glutamate--tRNA ligase [Clostridiales bacterium]|nr:glutamate--tRNA ligase [Clostridiales bacterium]